MKRVLVLAGAALGALLGAAACESAPEDRAPIVAGGSGGPAATEAARDCFTVNAVSGFRIVDEDTVRLTVGVNDYYEVDAGGATCTSLRFANRIAVQSEPQSSFLCVGEGPMTASIRTDQGDECLVSAIRRAPPEAPAPTAPTAAGGAE